MASSSRNEIQLGVGEESGVMLEPEESIQKIQRIPCFLRSNSDDYVPKVVSLGPYHHGKPELQLLQGFKHKVLQEFIYSSNRDVNFYRKKVLEVVDKARRCYADGSTDEFGDSKFAEMMLLDACFLLYFILSLMRDFDDFWCFSTHLHDQIGSSAYLFLQHDMFMFENQIPLWIVEFLFNAKYGNTTIRISWKQVLVKHCQTSLFGVEYKDDPVRQDKPLHLLEAFHMQMSCKSDSSPSSGSGCWPNIKRSEINSTIMLQKEKFEEYGYIFRSVMDLKSKGIHFARSDNIYSVMSIKFESNLLYAKLKLPIWYASPLSRVFFTNMIAYELCPNSRTNLEVISYVNFIKSLIVCPNDVKELREKRIIKNDLGDDMEVVQLFKGLNTHTSGNPYIFREVKWKIQKHYDSKAKTWMAELLYTYLRSPWSIIALLAACVLLVLTFAQTYATFNPHS